MADANGLKTVTTNTPISPAITSAGVRNCQTDTPAARVTISSLVLVRREKVQMPPNRAAKGSSFCARPGSFRNAICTTMAKDASSSPLARRNSSIMSIRNTSDTKTPNTKPMPIRKLRPR